MKNRNFFWGIFFVVAAILIIFNQLGYFTSINIFSLFITLMLIPIVIKSIYRLNFWGILFPLAIFCIIFSGALGIESLTPWPVLFAALLGSIGLSMIIKPRHGYNNERHGHHSNEHFNETIDLPDDEITEYVVNFGSGIKYINSNNLKKAVLRCSFGAMKVYFDKSTLSENGAEINIDVSFSGLELYIPKNWNIKNNINLSLAGIEEKNASGEKNGPIVVLTGSASLSGIEIIYV